MTFDEETIVTIGILESLNACEEGIDEFMRLPQPVTVGQLKKMAVEELAKQNAPRIRAHAIWVLASMRYTGDVWCAVCGRAHRFSDGAL